jgi:hypothetical protein
VSKTVTIRVPGLKVAVPLPADSLPNDLVPADGPPGEPTIDLVLEGGLTARAKVNGRNYRRMMKQIAEAGAGNVAIVLQGTLRSPAAPGQPFVLADAGFQVNIKTPKPAGFAAGRPESEADELGGG